MKRPKEQRGTEEQDLARSERDQVVNLPNALVKPTLVRSTVLALSLLRIDSAVTVRAQNHILALAGEHLPSHYRNPRFVSQTLNFGITSSLTEWPCVIAAESV